MSFSPFEDEQSQDSNHHLEYVSFVLDLYGKQLQDAICLIGDNCFKNRAFSDKADLHHIGWASHRFYRAVEDISEDSNNVVENVHKLMRKLKTPIPAAKLRRYTDLKENYNCPTRRSSVYNMLERYQKIRKYLPKTERERIEDYHLLVPREEKVIDSLMVTFSKLNSVRNMLQDETVALCTSRALFDGVMETFLSTKN